MPVLCLASVSGSPGVTTTAVGLASVWPRPVVLVEADPLGGNAILAGFFGGLLAPPGGLLDLVMAHRQGRLAGAFPELLVDLPGTHAKILGGIGSFTQAGSLPPLWLPLLECLRDLERSGTDVLVDAGRLGMPGWPEPLVLGADVTVLMVGSGLPALAAARARAADLAGELGGTPTRLGVVVVGPGWPYSAGEVSRTLALNVLETLVWDPAGASVFSAGADRPRHFDRSGYLRSLMALGEELRAPRGATQHRPGMEWILSMIQQRIANEQR